MSKAPTATASFKAAQYSIVEDMFVRTADENYIMARWAAAQRLHIDFLWNSVHALEKYMKAVLLLNGLHGKGGHKIDVLFERVKQIAGPLLPTMLTKPADLNIHHWQAMTPEAFIERLYQGGNADNRYLLYGFVTRSQDLHMLDAMVFAIRRLICRLDDRYIQSKHPNAPTFTNRQQLLKAPTSYRPLGLPLDQQVNAKEASELRHAALNLNLAFAPDDYPHTSMRGGTAARNPVLVRRIFDPLKSTNADSVREGVALADWVLANIQVPKGVPSATAEIEAARDAAKKKHKLP